VNGGRCSCRGRRHANRTVDAIDWRRINGSPSSVAGFDRFAVGLVPAKSWPQFLGRGLHRFVLARRIPSSTSLRQCIGARPGDGGRSVLQAVGNPRVGNAAPIPPVTSRAPRSAGWRWLVRSAGHLATRGRFGRERRPGAGRRGGGGGWSTTALGGGFEWVGLLRVRGNGLAIQPRPAASALRSLGVAVSSFRQFPFGFGIERSQPFGGGSSHVTRAVRQGAGPDSARGQVSRASSAPLLGGRVFHEPMTFPTGLISPKLFGFYREIWRVWIGNGFHPPPRHRGRPGIMGFAASPVVNEHGPWTCDRGWGGRLGSWALVAWETSVSRTRAPMRRERPLIAARCRYGGPCSPSRGCGVKGVRSPGWPDHGSWEPVQADR